MGPILDLELSAVVFRALAGLLALVVAF